MKCPCCDQDMPGGESKPIMRVSALGHDREIGAGLMDVHELMVENGGYEDSAWDWIGHMLDDANGVYDDSDYRSNVVVWYIAQDKELLRNQANFWLSSTTEDISGFELEPFQGSSPG